MSYGVLAGIAVGLFLLIYMFFKLNRFNDSEQGKNHFLLQLIVLFFILVLFVLLGKATLDVSNNCEQELVNTTMIDSSYVYDYDIVCNASPYETGTIFYKIILWFVRIFSFYIFIYIAYEVLKYFGVVVTK